MKTKVSTLNLVKKLAHVPQVKEQKHTILLEKTWQFVVNVFTIVVGIALGSYLSFMILENQIEQIYEKIIHNFLRIQANPVSAVKNNVSA